MTTSMSKYTFETTPTYELSSGKKHGKNHRRHNSKDSENNHNDHDPTDGSGSLTYSAASSINSNAGESTDSSFADIMRVLDVQDSKELAAVLQKERARHSNSHFGTARGDEQSIAAASAHSLTYSTGHSLTYSTGQSLTYSTDAESHMRSLATDAESGLHGTGILSTITGYVVC